MGWSAKNLFTTATGADGLVKAGKAASQGDWKGARTETRDAFWDASTIGLSAVQRDKEKARKEAEAKSAQVGQGVDARMDQSFKTQEGINRDKLAGTKGAFDKMDAADNDYKGRVQDLMTESKISSTDSRRVYDSMSTKYDDMQESADLEASKAMGLSEYGNANNRVQTETRGLYNAEGQAQRDLYNQEGEHQQGFYDKQATGETRRGQADYGTLAALGSQAAGLGMTGPMTVGQQMAMMAQGQGAAAEAYANTQRRVQGLRDQGLQAHMMNRDRGLERQSGLRERGISAGFERNDALFSAGQSAKNRQEGLARDRRGLENDFRSFEMANRGEREGFSQNKLGAEQRVNQRGLDMTNMSTGMRYEMERAKVADTMRRAGKSEEAIRTQLAQLEGDMAGYQKMVGGVVGTAGTVVGSIYGGPAGGAAGKAAGDGISAGATTPTQQPAQQPGPAPQGFRSSPGAAGDPYASNAYYGNANPAALDASRNYLDQRGPDPAPRSAQTPGFDSYLNRKYGQGRPGVQVS